MRGVALTAFGLTDVGRKRKHNEDAYLLDVERGLFVVADGMGGHVAGEVASRLTVESIQEFISGTEDDHDNTWPFGYNNRYSVEGNRLSTAVERANEKVMRAVVNRPELKGMGTTVVAALFDEQRATLVHVGDSRAYLLRGGELRRLTDDHSWVQEQVNAGILSEEEAKTHPLKNVVTRALGGGAHVAVDLMEIPTGRGDRFLLCSDGLTGMVADEVIADLLRSDKPLEVIVTTLITLANEAGGVDNITAIMVEVGGDQPPAAPPPKPAAEQRTSSIQTAVSLRPVDVDSTVPTTSSEGPSAPLDGGESGGGGAGGVGGVGGVGGIGTVDAAGQGEAKPKEGQSLHPSEPPAPPAGDAPPGDAAPEPREPEKP